LKFSGQRSDPVIRFNDLRKSKLGQRKEILMADPTKTYPLPKISFLVEWGGTRIGLLKSAGLDFETRIIEYREGSSPLYNGEDQPGAPNTATSTLKRDFWVILNFFPVSGERP
jgi:hypothetical protein